MINKKIGFVAVIGLMQSLLASVSHGQQAVPGAAVEQDSSVGLQEITVTATRRSTNLQTTPVSVTAVDESLLQQAAPRNIGDIALFVPNFSADTIQGFNAASFAIRGVGQDNIIDYYEPPVAVLVDDFVLTSVQTQLLDTFDVSQVEVLRGPQGTLFGKNTTGGAVTVRTKRPELNDFGAEGLGSYGSFNDSKLQGALNIPIIPGQLAARIVVSRERSDGYYKQEACAGPVLSFVPSKFAGVSSCGDGGDAGGTDVIYSRAKLLWEPGSGFSAYFQFEYLDDTSQSPPAVNTSLPNNPSFLFTDLVPTSTGLGDPLDRVGVSCRAGFWIDNCRGDRIDVRGEYLTLEQDVGVGKITNVSGYRDQKAELVDDYDGLPGIVAADGEQLSMFDGLRADRRDTWQEELRFASNFNGPFDFVAGAFYQHEAVQFCSDQILGFQDLVGPASPYGAWNDTPYILCNSQTGRSEAGYIEGNYKFTDRFTLTVGGRYTWEHKLFEARQQTFIQNLSGVSNPNFTWRDIGYLDGADFSRFPSGVITNGHSWKDPTWRISPSYQIDPQVFLYATYARGFKSGGYNDQIGTFAPFGNDLAAFKTAANPTNPEKADSYEIGAKYESADHRLRINVTGFLVKYEDLQKQIVVPIDVGGTPFQVTTFFNAAQATVRGVEFEASAVPVYGLTIRMNVSGQDGRYNKFVTPLPAGYNLADAPLDRTPKFTAGLDANYGHDLPWPGKLILDANASFVGRNLDSQSITAMDENAFLDSRTLFNGSVGYASAGERYLARILIKNITDRIYNTSSQTVGGLWENATYGPPRTIAFELSGKY